MNNHNATFVPPDPGRAEGEKRERAFVSGDGRHTQDTAVRGRTRQISSQQDMARLCRFAASGRYEIGPYQWSETR
jgi:hypothetical protein